MALISLNNLERFFNNLKTYISNALNSKANTSHTHTSSDITDLTVDSALSSSSENPVQNKVVKNALDGKLDVTDVFATWSYANGNLEIPNVFSNTVDSSLSNSSENPVQNKVINAALAGYIPRSGGAVMTGSSLGRTVNDSELRIDGGTSGSNGSAILLRGKDKTGNGGETDIVANDGTDSTTVNIKPNGTITRVTNNVTKNVAMREDVVPRSGGAVITGNLSKTSDNGEFRIDGGIEWSHGGSVGVLGKNAPSFTGCVRFFAALSSTNFKDMNLYPNGTWTWTGTAVQLVSDARLKQQISHIDNKLLDAWEDVELSQFKYNDAVNEKGDNARLHTGYVVQQIDAACKSHNVDISEYGLYCHEEYPERTEEVEVEKEDGTKVKETKVIREASEHYSLRYTEIYAIECAYLRKKNKELQEQLDNVIARLDKLEKGDNVK